MSQSVFHSAVSPSVVSSATPTSSSFPPLPTGCAHLSGVTASGDFHGCVVGFPNILQQCCAAVGSTATFVNDTCGCPYNSVFLQTDQDSFFHCTDNYNVSAGCSGSNLASGAMPTRTRWNAALVVLGVSLLIGAVGV